jgi:hypothetical protein
VLLAILMAVLLQETAKYQRTVYLARRGQDFFVALLTEIRDALLHAKLYFHRHRNRGVLQSRLSAPIGFSAWRMVNWWTRVHIQTSSMAATRSRVSSAVVGLN